MVVNNKIWYSGNMGTLDAEGTEPRQERDDESIEGVGNQKLNFVKSECQRNHLRIRVSLNFYRATLC